MICLDDRFIKPVNKILKLNLGEPQPTAAACTALRYVQHSFLLVNCGIILDQLSIDISRY